MLFNVKNSNKKDSIYEIQDVKYINIQYLTIEENRRKQGKCVGYLTLDVG